MLYINDITEDVDSELRLFADDCVCYREINGIEDTMNFYKDIDRLGRLAKKWVMGNEIPTIHMQYNADYKVTDLPIS